MGSVIPSVLSVRRTSVSPFFEVIARDIGFSDTSDVQTYHAVGQPDYVVALAVTPESRILLVRQYRPAIERFSLELPAGMVDAGEQPQAAIERELFEETGHRVDSMELIGTCATCSSRISNVTYSYFVRTTGPVSNFAEEPGIAVSCVTSTELGRLIRSGDFNEQTHIGVLALACARNIITFNKI